MKRHFTGNVYWVGKTEWELNSTHSTAFKLHRGTSYNAYVVEDEKMALLDTVRGQHHEEFVDNLAAEGILDRLDYYIAQHLEPDHGGCLTELMRRRPDLKIYCSPAGRRSIAGYHDSEGWDITEVKTGETLSLGEKDLTFIEAPMLHWPDTMFSFLSGDNVLFSNDGFGQHYASEYLWSDEVDPAELREEALKYFTCILNPFAPMVKNKIEEIQAMDITIEAIATSHGVSWRGDLSIPMNMYLEWCDAYQENQVTVVYDSMWSSTREIAEELAYGIREDNHDICIKIMSTAKYAENDIMAEVFKSKAILVGSPTINSGILPSMAAALEEIRGLRFKNKKFMAFGSYGWSGEAVPMIEEKLEAAGFDKMRDGLRMQWQPNQAAREEVHAVGKEIGAALK